MKDGAQKCKWEGSGAVAWDRTALFLSPYSSEGTGRRKPAVVQTLPARFRMLPQGARYAILPRMWLKDTMRYLVVGAVFAVPLLPLVVMGSLFFPFITGKNFLFRIIIEIGAAAWVVLMLWDARWRPRFSWILAAFAAFLVSLFISDLLSPNVFKSFWSNFERMEGWVTHAHLFLYFLLLTTVLTTEKMWRAFFSTTVAVAAVVGVKGLLQLWPYLIGQSQGTRIDVTFGNPTYLAIYAVFHLFIIAYLMREYWEVRWLRVAYALVALLQVLMLFYTATRGAILGFLGGAFLTGVLVALFERRNPLLRKIAVGAVAAVLLVVAGFFAAKDTAFVRESPVLSRFASISLSGGTVASRFMIWEMAWEGFKERPVFGWGQESFNFVFNKYYNPNMYEQEPWFDRTHNIFFDWLIAGGAVGAFLYFSLLGAALYYLWLYAPPRKKEEEEEAAKSAIDRIFARLERHPLPLWERALWTGLLAAYFFHNLFVFDNLTSYLLYFAFLAYLHVRVTRGREPMGAQWKCAPETVATVVAPVVFAVALSFAYFANVRPMNVAANLVESLRTMQFIPRVQSPEQKRELVDRVQELYERAVRLDFIGSQETREQFLQSAARVYRLPDLDSDRKLQFIDAATLAMEGQLQRVPNDARTQLFTGAFLADVGRVQQAVPYLEKARELSPNKQTILLELGSRYIGLGQKEKALELFREAFELAPQFDTPRVFYALGLMYNNRYDEGEALFFDAEGNKLVRDPQGKYFLNASGTPILNDDRFLRVYEVGGRYDRIIPILEYRVEKDPGNTQAYVSLAAGYLGAGNEEKAIATIERAMEKDPAFKAQGENFIADIKSGKYPR